MHISSNFLANNNKSYFFTYFLYFGSIEYQCIYYAYI